MSFGWFWMLGAALTSSSRSRDGRRTRRTPRDVHGVAKGLTKQFLLVPVKGIDGDQGCTIYDTYRL